MQEKTSAVRGTIGGRPASDAEVSAILKESDDPRLRRAAWEASKAAGAAVADDVRALARLRTRRPARRASPTTARSNCGGRRSIPRGSTRSSCGWTRRPRARFARTSLGSTRGSRSAFAARRALEPWHYEDPFFQEAPEVGRPSFDRLFEGHVAVALARRTFTEAGFDVDGVLARSDLFPRPGKCGHAFCTHVDRRGDVRVLCNVVPGERWVGTTLHELGHAVYDLSIDRSLPWVLRTPPHASSTEGVAMLFGRLSRDPEWLVPALSLPETEAAAVASAAGDAFAESMLVFTRWVLVMSRFEEGLYRDPEQDLSALWWGLVERFQGVRRPAGRDAPDWAAKIHVATAPVYYHAYLMGECTASQLSRRAREAAGGRFALSPEAGRFLRERFFAPGAVRSWDAHLRWAVGAPLDEAPLLADMGIPA